ncbi:MAG: hypothetical protein HYW24_02695 [Candidatus Aenigmarchaeota archaeon]|nr:hypothetical protein [Candidatus Aenigmarchaeota archaeon]
MSKRRAGKLPKTKKRTLTREEFIKIGLMIAAGGIAISGIVSDRKLEPVYKQAELTLENAKRSSDPEFVQAYLNNILYGDKTSLLYGQVVYDPGAMKSIEFWEDQLARHPEKEDFVKRRIEETRQVIENLRIYHGKGEGGLYVPHSSIVTHMGLDGSKNVFVYEIPPFVDTDEDLRWMLDHESCHLNLSSNLDPYNVLSPENEDTVEEALCFKYSVLRKGDFNVSQDVYNAVYRAYQRLIYDRLVKEARSPDPEGQFIRQLLDRGVFLNPYELKPR